MWGKIVRMALLILLVTSCESKLLLQAHSLDELVVNKENRLNLPVEQDLDLMKHCEEWQNLDLVEMEERLQKKGVGLFEASYGFHFLGNAYFQQDSFDKGLYYQKVAAETYLNPLANLRLARIYTKTASEIKSRVPKGEAMNFKQDYGKVYTYLNKALNYAILTMSKLNDRTIIDDVNHFAAPLIEVFQKRDSVILGDFDVTAWEIKTEKKLPQLEASFHKIYGKKAALSQ